MVGNFASERVHVVEAGRSWTRTRFDTRLPSTTLGLQPSLDDRVAHHAAASEPESLRRWYWRACHEGERSVEHMLLTPEPSR